MGGCILLALIFWLAVCVRRRKQESASRPQSEVATVKRDQLDRSTQHSPAWAGNKSELSGDGSFSPSFGSPRSMQQSWSRPMSEVEGSAPTYPSIGTFQSQELADSSKSAYKPYKRAEIPPVGLQGAPSRTTSQASYRAGNQLHESVYEMPAQLPGSTLP